MTNDQSSAALPPSGSPKPGVLDTTRSPYVRLRGIGMGECRWTEGFWGKKFRQCQEVMVPHMGTILQGDVGHALNNFLAAAGRQQGGHAGTAWHDGDFYKWMESVVHVYAITRDEELLTELDGLIEIIAEAQQYDGYLSTYNQLNGIVPFSHRNHHELYNAGHLATAACVHHRVTGQTNFLDIAIKNADYLYATFAPRPPALARFGYNQSQIMGLVELYRTTRDARYLELAELFINMRGESPVEPDPTVRHTMIGDMVQERTPLRDETHAVGHAVLALYLYSGAADVAAETGDAELLGALDRIWSDIVERRMYLTGACGQTHHGSSSQSDATADFVHEAFIDEYMMPNLTAYNETCANVANAMFNYRMLGLHGESKYADIIELVMFNSALSGLSLDGIKYTYANPLRALDGARDFSLLSTETPDRQPYLNCFCCPPNIVRTVAQLSSWAYSLTDDGIAVNLYGGNELSTHLPDGSALRLRQETQYPWVGDIRLVVDECRIGPFDILLRVPRWASGGSVYINDNAVDAPLTPGSFLTLRRAWSTGDVIELHLPLAPELVVGHPRIEEVRNQVAVRRGPIVYCVESIDLAPGCSVLDVHVPSDVTLSPTTRPDLLGGVVTLEAELIIGAQNRTAMYSVLTPPTWEHRVAQLIPYFAWNNRGRSEMTVWMPIIWR